MHLDEHSRGAVVESVENVIISAWDLSHLRH
jgi:hypothetical protein